MEIDALEPTDLDAALALSRQAGWNQVRADWRRLLEHPIAWCYAGRVDGGVVATATVIAYDGRVAWIGMVLVDEAHRRRGYGTALVERALERATDAADTVGLDATDAGRPLYRELGFVDACPVERRVGTLRPSGDPDRESTVPVATVERVADASAVLDRDEGWCGIDRRSLLWALVEEPETTTFVADPADPRGYAVLRPGRVHRQLGPLVATDRAALSALLDAAAVELGGDSVIVDAVVAGDDETNLLPDRGLALDRRLTRMSHGCAELLLCGDDIHGAAGLELG
jgi:GNAT superfamily N-acetyltransferase